MMKNKTVIIVGTLISFLVTGISLISGAYVIFILSVLPSGVGLGLSLSAVEKQ